VAIVHVPVLLEEVLSFLVPQKPCALMVDCTLGEGGHAEAFLSRYPGLRYLGLDVDPAIQAEARTRLAPFAPRVGFELGYFDELLASWEALGSMGPEIPGRESGSALPRPDLVLFDLGISMHHYLESGRGFGFRLDEALDMRLNPEAPRSAADIVNGEREEELARIIYEYGEERLSRRIARGIVEARSKSRIVSTAELASIVESSVPAQYRHGRIHPATRTFQALRIAVNDELGRAERGIRAAAGLLAPGGILGVISFHSLEDRIAKNIFRELAGRSTQAPDEPIQKEKGPVEYELLCKKPLEARPEEAEANPASRSAKLRVLRRLSEAKPARVVKKEKI
jgi:16S rRNA (cytosine1402-N4)-methyltransferase